MTIRDMPLFSASIYGDEARRSIPVILYFRSLRALRERMNQLPCGWRAWQGLLVHECDTATHPIRVVPIQEVQAA